MKRVFFLRVCVACVSCVLMGMLSSSYAALVDQGSFIDSGSGLSLNLIYDTDRDITWLGDANFAKTTNFDANGLMTWTTANSWAQGLSIGGLDDWRLPRTLVPDVSCQIAPAHGVFCNGSEMGHLFYNELGGSANQSILTSADPDLALFENIQNFLYWSETPIAGSRFAFGFDVGTQIASNTSNGLYAWAVHEGTVAPVPIPSAMLLMGTGLVGLIGLRGANSRHRGR